MFSCNLYKHGKQLHKRVLTVVKTHAIISSGYFRTHAERYVYDKFSRIWEYQFQTEKAWEKYIMYIPHAYDEFHDWCTCKSPELYEYIFDHGCLRRIKQSFLSEIPNKFQTTSLVKKAVKYDRRNLFYVRKDLQTEDLILDGMSEVNVVCRIRKNLRPFYERYYSIFMEIHTNLARKYEGIKLETEVYNAFRKRIKR